MNRVRLKSRAARRGRSEQRGRAALPRVECLEDRLVLSPATLGPEFPVFDPPPGEYGEAPSVGIDAAGNVLVAWSGGATGGDADVFARRIGSDGVPMGGPFRVSSAADVGQLVPVVAVARDGSAVVVWESHFQDPDYTIGVYGQRLTAAGTAAGDEFRVNTTVAGPQLSPAVAMDAVGNFTVVWESPQDPDGSSGVYLQRYDAAGGPLGGEVRVHDTFAGGQLLPRIAMNAAGDFAVVWEQIDGSEAGVYARRFSALGVPSVPEFLVSPLPAEAELSYPDVTINAAGEFAVTWEVWVPDLLSGAQPFVQRYHLDGSPLGEAFRVNSTTEGFHRSPHAVLDDEGNLFVVWTVERFDGFNTAILVQEYDARVVRQGGEVRVSVGAPVRPEAPAISLNADGDLVVAWDVTEFSYGDQGITARRFDADLHQERRLPVILVPGILGSLTPDIRSRGAAVRRLPGFLTHETSYHPRELENEQVNDSYNALLAALEDAGYHFCDPDIPGRRDSVDCDSDSDLFFAAYDWRQPVLVNPVNPDELLWDDDEQFESGVEYLDWWIELARTKWMERYGDDVGFAVNIVAHSMGGLLARAYIEEADEAGQVTAPIEHLIMLGTPNYGSVSTYQFWDPVVRAVGIRAEDRAMRAILRGAVSRSGRATSALVPSLRDLMPTFPFLLRGESAVPEFEVTNFLLMRLNETHDDLVSATDILLAGTTDLATPIMATLRPEGRRGEITLRFVRSNAGDLRVLYSAPDGSDTPGGLLFLDEPFVRKHEFSRVEHGDLPEAAIDLVLRELI